MRRGDRLTAALSGGADSVVLLHIPRRLSFRHGFHLSALHVNHGISQNATVGSHFASVYAKHGGFALT
ncbi:MAG: hypothetical protein IPG33_00130 [Betaproteobacteria bacterium]|nr:hypothetical protein [Betaproteobacteria bacterium]